MKVGVVGLPMLRFTLAVLLQAFAPVTVTVYTPDMLAVALGILTFCWLALPAGPVHE